MRFLVPFPPTTGNHAHKRNGARAIVTAEVQTYRDSVKWVCLEQNAATGILGRLSVSAKFAYPDKRSRDLDNLWKVVGDACTHAGVWKDDSQIHELHLVRTTTELKGGFVEITVSTQDEP